MNPAELEVIEMFLASVSKVSLYTWLEASPDGTPEETDVLLKRKRMWAQGQQANPRHRDEAQFILKNYGLLQRVLVDEADEWRLFIHEALVARAIDTLLTIARSHVMAGELSENDEQAILDRARALDLDIDVVRWRLEEALREIGAHREGADDRASEIPVVPPTDLYVRLDLSPDASESDIERAYLAKTGWAAGLSSAEQSALYLHAVEEAWETLSQPDRRAAYDETQRQLAATATEAAHRAHLLAAVRTRAQPALPSGTPNVRKLRPPVIAIEGVQVLRVQVADKPVRLEITVRNDGSGRMPGSVRSDADWLRVPSPQLDPHAGKQTITLEIATPDLPWGKNVARVLVDGDHGQQVALPVEVHRFPLARVVRNTVFLGTWLIAMLLLTGGAIDYYKRSAPGTIRLTVRPLADHVLVNGTDLGGGTNFDIAPKRSGQRMHIVVAASGFREHVEILTARQAEALEHDVALDLLEPMAWTPPAEPPLSEVPEAWSQGLAAVAEQLSACAPAGGTFKGTAWVSAAGEVEQLDVTEADFEVGTVAPCLRRAYRSLRMQRARSWANVPLEVAIPPESGA